MSASKPGPGTSADDADAASLAENLSPSFRILLAVEKIAALGPITYEALRLELGVSKTATWRLVATLKDAGWVRLRHGGRVIELDHRLDDLFATAHFADQEFASVADTMTALGESHAVHLDLFVMNARGELDLHETTRRMTAAAHPIDTQDEVLMLAVRRAMTAPQLERHLQQVDQTMEPEALRALRRTLQRVKSDSAPGYTWSHEGRFLVVPVRGSMGTPAALRFSSRSGAGRADELVAAFEDMNQRARHIVETFAGMGDAA
ncbi:hypothetical protein HKCCSP123_14385 [Rhodobacterales bacterium HKCCSP123]|nr:hypothetical protein [Rhodobacterales bacterium HKCCSP123]